MLSSEEDSEESDTVSDHKENSEDDLVIADLDEHSLIQMPFLTVVPDEEVAEITVQASTEWKNKQKNASKQKKRAKNEKRITLKIKMEKGTGKVADLSPSIWPNTRQMPWMGLGGLLSTRKK